MFYGAGVTLGIVASLLILLYIFSKFVPKVSVVSVFFLLADALFFSLSLSLTRKIWLVWEY